MALYISIALLGALVALPDDDRAMAPGPHGWALIGLIWGTTVGLALAHWFAFVVAARGMSGGRRTADVELGLAQIAGAACVALLATLPILVTSDRSDQEAATLMPTLVIGLTGYAVARLAGRARVWSAVTGVALALAGIAVAIVKIELVGH